MAYVEINMGEAKDIINVPDGAYEVVIEKKPEAFVAESGKETPCLKWFMTIAAIAGQEHVAGQEMWRNTPMTGKGAGFTEMMLKGFGIPFTAEGEGDSRVIRFDDDDTLNKRGIAHVKQRQYEDKNTKEKKIVSDVKSVTPISLEAAAAQAAGVA